MARPRPRASLVRAALLLLALAAVTRLVWQLAQAPLAEVRSVVTGAGPAGLLDLPVDRALAAISAAALAGCWVWLALSVVVVVADAVTGAVSPGRPARGRRWVPAGLRRAVLACCGVALVGSLAAPAHADTTSQAQAVHARTDGLPLPDRALGGPPADDGRPAAAATAPSVVTVRAGDTLWAIARRFLPPDATTTEIAAAWRRIARANANRLGAGPDLIYPGTRLRVPRPLDSKGAHHAEDHS
jgi:hypothetical protein